MTKIMSKQKELVQYYIVNTDCGMSAGKTAAQVAHASMLIALRDQHQENFQLWREIDMKKIVLGAEEERLEQIIEENPTVIRIIDKGFTEIEPNTLTVLVLPVMTRKEAYKWVHGLKTLRLGNEDMSYKDEQEYIKRTAKGEKGIFYLPELGTYSSSTLVDNPHPILLAEEGDTIEQEEPYIEHGSIDYIISETMYALNKTIIGPIYVYKVKGEQTHDHSIQGVYRDAVNNWNTFEFVEPVEEYFSKNDVKIIESIIEYQKSQNSNL